GDADVVRRRISSRWTAKPPDWPLWMALGLCGWRRTSGLDALYPVARAGAGALAGSSQFRPGRRTHSPYDLCSGPASTHLGRRSHLRRNDDRGVGHHDAPADVDPSACPGERRGGSHRGHGQVLHIGECRRRARVPGHDVAQRESRSPMVLLSGRARLDSHSSVRIYANPDARRATLVHAALWLLCHRRLCNLRRLSPRTLSDAHPRHRPGLQLECRTGSYGPWPPYVRDACRCRRLGAGGSRDAHRPLRSWPHRHLVRSRDQGLAASGLKMSHLGEDMLRVGRLLIVGGGIAGLTLTTALRRHGLDVELIERESHWQVMGGGIAVQPNAMRVLREFGLDAAVAHAGAIIRRWQFRDQYGDVLCDIELEPLWREVGPFVGIERTKLHDVLQSGAGSCRLGTWITALSQHHG